MRELPGPRSGQEHRIDKGERTKKIETVMWTLVHVLNGVSGKEGIIFDFFLFFLPPFSGVQLCSLVLSRSGSGCLFGEAGR